MVVVAVVKEEGASAVSVLWWPRYSSRCVLTEVALASVRVGVGAKKSDEAKLRGVGRQGGETDG